VASTDFDSSLWQLQVDNDAQPIQPSQHIVNGTTTGDDVENLSNKHITTVEDQLNSADVSVSGGSDTEASRGDGSKQKDGDRGHGRTGSSIKKPATFKAVSVNKTFLAASKANGGVTSSKLSDKPASGSSTPPTGFASLSGTRPRLVVKPSSGTGSALGSATAANGRKPATAPDPNVVWNKNRRTLICSPTLPFFPYLQYFC
jgi:hypothetical protein